MNSRDLITEYGLKPNKALGQNFLTDEAAIGRIVSLATEPCLPVIEIGPGLGALTEPLAASGLPLAAVELDASLADILAERMPKNVRVIRADFLKADLNMIHAELGGGKLTFAGNLPYYITSPIVEKLVTSGLPISRMVLMMQDEAADRFFAGPGDKNYGPLTVMARLCFSVTSVLSLSPASYTPMPEVNSRVLLFESRGISGLPEGMERLVKRAFSMRRKTLLNNLSAAGIPKDEAAALIEEAGLPPSVRGEALTESDFVRLCALAAPVFKRK